MRKLSDVILEQRPLIMNETASVMAACERMRECQAGSVLVTGDTGRLVGIFTGRDAVCRVSWLKVVMQQLRSSARS